MDGTTCLFSGARFTATSEIVLIHLGLEVSGTQSWSWVMTYLGLILQDHDTHMLEFGAHG